jgi:hypothetical protein
MAYQSEKRKVKLNCLYSETSQVPDQIRKYFLQNSKVMDDETELISSPSRGHSLQQLRVASASYRVTFRHPALKGLYL